jgi:hypothetical protein
MTVVDSHSFADHAQGRISHVELHMTVDFAQRTLRVRADYLMDREVAGPLFLDCRGQAITSVSTGAQAIEWQKDAPDTILGERLVLANLYGSKTFTISMSRHPASAVAGAHSDCRGQAAVRL